MQDNINLDAVLDYRRLYSAEVSKAHVSGNRLTGLCPFHNDAHEGNFGVDLTTGKFNCFACGIGGNYVSFIAQRYGMDKKEAYKKILLDNGLSEQRGKGKGSNTTPTVVDEYTVAQYAEEKRLNPTTLRTVWGMQDGLKDSRGAYIKVPYMGTDGLETTFRKRYPKGAAMRFAWKKGSTGDILSTDKSIYAFYGLQFLTQIKEYGYVVLVEGESDTQTLWAMDIPALGVPGATNLQVKWIQEYLMDVPVVYIHREPDNGGKTFVSSATRAFDDAQFPNALKIFSVESAGVKDPNELWVKNGADAKQQIMSLLEGAEPYRLDQEIIKQPIPGVSAVTRCPRGFVCDTTGIWKLDKKTDELVRVCGTPMMITRMLKVLNSAEVRMELSYFQDGQVYKLVAKCSDLLNKTTIVNRLADRGIGVSTSNASAIVEFLTAMIAENTDAGQSIIPVDTMVTQTGWVDRKFIPYKSDGLVMAPENESFLTALHKNGFRSQWIDAMSEARIRWRFRFILSAAFAAPLLSILHGRIFCVFNWGDSRGGKTAALKAGLSVWGDPDKLMLTFNSTENALEGTCAVYNDLAVGIDEKQIANRDLSSMIYKLCEGTGRRKMNRDSSLKDYSTWMNLFLCTGEQPIINSSTMSGVSTRIIEVQGSPFRDFSKHIPTEADRRAGENRAAQMYQSIAEHYGWAGPEFIEYLSTDAGRETAKSLYKMYQAKLTELCPGNNPNHISNVCMVAVADSIAGELFFDEEPCVVDGAVQMNNETISMCKHLLEQVETEQLHDINDSAVGALADWIVQHKANFGDDTKFEYYGFFDDDTVYILPIIAEKAMKEMGYDYRKTMKEMKDSGMLKFTTEKSKTRYTVVKRNALKVPTRYIGILTDKLFEKEVTSDLSVADSSEELPF